MTVDSPADRKRPARMADQAQAPDAPPKPWPQWNHASGDWGGLRRWLSRHGVVPEIMYTSDLFANLAGGDKRGVQALGNLDLTVTFHTEALGLWSGGVLFVYVESSVGKGVSESNIGNLQTVSNIDPTPRFNWTQLSALYYQQSFFSNRLRVLAGKHDANNHFAVPVFAEPLLNSAFDLTDTVPMPTFPDTGLGLALLAQPLDRLAVSAAVYNGNTDGNGNRTLFANIKGLFAIGEVAVALSPWGYPAKARAGGWINNNSVESVGGQTAAGGGVFSGNYGFYLALDQRLARGSTLDAAGEGPGWFFQLGWAPADRNEITLYIGGGIAWTGFVPGRGSDVAAFGIAHAAVSGELTDRTSETVLEGSYLAELTPWLSLQPDVQYVINPAGDGQNALALGLRIELSF